MINSEPILRAYETVYKGRTFVYKSKYGSNTLGIVNHISICTNFELDGTCQLEIGVMSENGNYYAMNEIYFKPDNE